MKIGICSIQRNRAKWLKEWISFHHIVGCTQFYIYLHNCTDDSESVIRHLQRFFDIKCFILSADIDRPQISAYEHCYQTFGHEIDWMAFIDGDEFLFPKNSSSLKLSLEPYNYGKLSAIAVFWKCFGSSFHINDPDGLIIEDYLYRASHDFPANRHIKSIVKGGQGQHVSSKGNAHIFKTIFGTVDESFRPIIYGFNPELPPTYDVFQLNHYVVQSREFFINFKSHSGAADAGSAWVRDENWWETHNRNDEIDREIHQFLPDLKHQLLII